VSAEDPESLRARLLDGWDEAARGWRRRADGIQRMGMPVSAWMVEHLELHPGEVVLELAAGPGDTGFLAAELVLPAGRLISSDASERMLEVARERARAQGIDNVEFKQLQLEWIDLETASVDAILCRWGVMLSVDPAAALQECRRVLRPGGRLALAVWDELERNPWAEIPGRAVEELGFAEPPERGLPGPFALSAPGVLDELLQEAGFVEPLVEAVQVERVAEDLDSFLDESLDISQRFAATWARLSDEQQARLITELSERLEPFTASDGSLRVPGRTLAALAQA
jgi:SAM-dependent methyltransferase